MRQLISRFRKPLLTLVTLGILGSATASYLAADRLLVTRGRELEPRHHRTLEKPDEFGLEIVPFSAETDEGYSIAAYWIAPAPKPGRATKFRRLQSLIRSNGTFPVPLQGENRGTVLMFHGRGAIKEDHFPIAERFCAAGFSCIAFDARSTGASTAPYATYGHREKHDATAVLNTAIDRFELHGHRFAAFGISRGGAEALQSAAVDPRLAAVVTVSTFADLGQLMHEVAAHRLTHFARPLVPLVCLWCQVRAGFDPSKIRPVDAAATITCPAMFVHGADDTYIAPHHSRKLYAALQNPAKRFELVPGAGHNNPLALGGDQLYHDISAFLYHQLSDHPAPPAATPADR